MERAARGVKPRKLGRASMDYPTAGHQAGAGVYPRRDATCSHPDHTNFADCYVPRKGFTVRGNIHQAGNSPQSFKFGFPSSVSEVLSTIDGCTCGMFVLGEPANPLCNLMELVLGVRVDAQQARDCARWLLQAMQTNEFLQDMTCRYALRAGGGPRQTEHTPPGPAHRGR